jgi:hypothetical protein
VLLPAAGAAVPVVESYRYGTDPVGVQGVDRQSTLPPSSPVNWS